MQSVPITTKVVSLNPTQYSIQQYWYCDKVCPWQVAGQWFSQEYSGFLDPPIEMTVTI
jgi:hypothetical protein